MNLNQVQVFCTVAKHLSYSMAAEELFITQPAVSQQVKALERDGASVAEAAYIAGYASAANFATAFRRFFGTSPKNFRARI